MAEAWRSTKRPAVHRSLVGSSVLIARWGGLRSIPAERWRPSEGARQAGSRPVAGQLKEGRAKALRTSQQEVVTPGLRGMFLPFARPRPPA